MNKFEYIKYYHAWRNFFNIKPFKKINSNREKINFSPATTKRKIRLKINLYTRLKINDTLLRSSTYLSEIIQIPFNCFVKKKERKN